MVYAPGGQKWRPTCTGSEVCIPMWTFHHTHSHTHTQTRSSARIPPLVSAVAWLPAFSFSFPKSAELSTLPVRGGRAATGCSWEGENFHQIFGSENGSGLPWRLPWPWQLAASAAKRLAHNVNIFFYRTVAVPVCLQFFLGGGGRLRHGGLVR